MSDFLFMIFFQPKFMPDFIKYVTLFLSYHNLVPVSLDRKLYSNK